MLKRRHRIPSREFRSAFRGALSGRCGPVSVRVSREKAHSPRVTVVVSKKSVGSSVARNALRRRGYTTAENLLRTDALPPHYYAFTLEKDAHNISHKGTAHSMKEAVRHALDKAPTKHYNTKQ